MVETNSTLCPSDNVQVSDQTSFWSSDGVNWDAHRIGWLIAGLCALVTVILTTITVSFHCRNYTNPGEQRQIIRILYMPAVYAIISFFSYRFFHDYTYYDLIECIYESVTLSAFLLLLIEYVASTAIGHDVDNAILRKEKSSLPMPFCCWRYRPTKPYFMYTVKWSVLQYIILRPGEPTSYDATRPYLPPITALSIAGIICQYYGVLCQSGPWSFQTAHAYLSVIDAISITIALYGLLIFYGLTKDELVGRKPLAKFLSIKLIVMFTFYQALVFSALEGKVIHATPYWTATNVADGLNALAICIEMVIFSAFMMYAYTWKEYVDPGRSKTSVGRPLIDSVNYSDFAHEIWGSLKFFVAYMRGKPGTHSSRVTFTDADGNTVARKTYSEAFGFERSASGVSTLSGGAGGYRARGGAGGGGESISMSAVRAPGESYEENARLAPYSYAGSGSGSSGELNVSSMENVSAPRY